MFSIHQQTIRLYEKEGLINPKRSEGNTRLFSEEDIERLEEIIHLTHKMGINIAGVEMILRLQRQVQKLQKEMNTMFESINKDLAQQNAEAQKMAHDTAKKISQFKITPLLPAVHKQKKTT